VIMQENRTPDNLFQALCTGNNCGTGTNQFDIASGGKCLYQGTEYNIPLKAIPLINCSDPGHYHGDWTHMYNSNGMDGACTYSNPCSTGSLYQCPAPISNLDCTRYTYVDNSSGAIQPYLDLAKQYGWANFMYQTNQGPSFPAHQFLLSGTSAPADIPHSQSPKEYTDFGMDNTGVNVDNAGCAANSHAELTLITPTGDMSTNIYPCLEHPTLTDLLDNATPPIPWRYYSGVNTGIWTAPNAISHICNNATQNGGGSCGSGNGSNQDWKNNVKPYLEAQTSLAPALADLQPTPPPSPNCNFPSNWQGGVIWVVPDGRWSDHPTYGVPDGNPTVGLGSDWVANIVNSIGLNNCPGDQPNWDNTVILITWDDWGGWYDHLSPKDPAHGPGIGYSNGSGGQYVYGFRVPLLVVGKWVKNDSPSRGHISNVTHDFGSILSFIEQTYNVGISGGIYPAYEYADVLAPDSTNPLGDFFCFPPACTTPPHQTFTPINLYNNSQCSQSICKSNACDATCLINYPGTPTDADTN
jgi:hypothetical protein